MTTTVTAPRIYVASLSDYNNGILHGVWVDLFESDLDELHEKVKAMLASSVAAKKYGDVAEEYAIHDYEGFGDYRLSEYASFGDVMMAAQLISEHGEAAQAFLANGSVAIGDDFGDLDEAFRESYQGTYDDEEDFARQFTSDIGGFNGVSSEVLEQLDSYLDWEHIGRELLQDGWSAKDSDHDLMVFRNL